MLVALLLLPATSSSLYAAAATFHCSQGTTIAHSDRAISVAACPSGNEGDECSYRCDPGFLPIGRHVCQNYSTMGVTVIDEAFFGGRCDKLCGANSSQWSCSGGLVPVRLNASEPADGGVISCLSTTCLSPVEALQRLARGNWEVWKLGRHNQTGMCE